MIIFKNFGNIILKILKDTWETLTSADELLLRTLKFMKSLVELQNEIESLTVQAQELRAKEFDRTLAEIVATLRAFGITLAQVRAAMKMAAKGSSKGKAKGKIKAKGPRGRKAKAVTGKKTVKAKAAKSGVRKPAPIKFRGPNGETWSGRGKTPKWLKAAVDAGQSAASFKI